MLSAARVAAVSDLLAVFPSSVASYVASLTGTVVVNMPEDFSEFDVFAIWRKNAQIDTGIAWLCNIIKQCASTLFC
jgi:DNA-binding transcriptional LysR family regulator